jgi:diaminopimelate decarboxylase
MLLPVTCLVNDKGNMEIGGLDVLALKEQYKTPLHVIDVKTVKQQCAQYINCFAFDDLKAEIIYASKAFCSLAMCRLISEQGLSIDVSTGGELFIALSAGFPAKDIYFHGNNKSKEEIRFGLANRIGAFIIDNFEEIGHIDALAKESDIVQDVMIRITPGIKASTHEYIQTGKIESKFGFGLSTGQAIKAVQEIVAKENVRLVGIHAHIGSQIFNISPYEKLIEVMAAFLKEVRDKLGVEIEQINIGGGLGVKYLADDKPASISDLAGLVYQAVKRYAKKFDVHIKKICLEPGRSIIGNAGITLYEVGVVKQIPGIKTYISVDGGMSDNIRPILYQAKYSPFVANKMHAMEKKDAFLKYAIVGKHCESGDIVVADAALPEVCVADTIAIATTGAYCYSMSSNYNGQVKGAVVAVEDKKSWVWIERQDNMDLIKGHRKLYEQ